MRNSKIENLIIASSKDYKFNTTAKKFIEFVAEQFIIDIVLMCENLATSRKYKKKLIGVSIVYNVIANYDVFTIDFKNIRRPDEY